MIDENLHQDGTHIAQFVRQGSPVPVGNEAIIMDDMIPQEDQMHDDHPYELNITLANHAYVTERQ